MTMYILKEIDVFLKVTLTKFLYAVPMLDKRSNYGLK